MRQQNTDESLRFVGVDLAWAVDRRHTGVAVMEGGARGVSLTDLSAELHSLEGVTQFIRAHLSKSPVIRATRVDLLSAGYMLQCVPRRRKAYRRNTYPNVAHRLELAREHTALRVAPRKPIG